MSHILQKNLLDEISFVDAISLVESLYENDFKQQKTELIDFIFNSTNHETKRMGMEYFIQQGETGLLEELIKVEKSSSDPLNREWACTYEILVMKNKGLLYGDRLNQTVLTMNSTSKEMHLLLCILHMFGVYQIGQYESFFKVSEAILPEVKKIEAPFIQTSYEFHLLELFCYSHLLMNQIEQCREVATKVTVKAKPHLFPNTAVNAYHILAQTYFFESYEMANQYLAQGFEFISYLPEGKATSKRKELNKTLDFLRSIWRKELDSTPEDPIEKAHRMIITGEKELGLSILNEYKLKQGNNLTAFQWYYYGLATGNEEDFAKSRKIFQAKKDKFFIKLLEKR